MSGLTVEVTFSTRRELLKTPNFMLTKEISIIYAYAHTSS
jgi:hypothetical protein